LALLRANKQIIPRQKLGQKTLFLQAESTGMTGGFFLFVELSPEQNSGDLLLRISLFRLRRFSGISNELKVDEPAVDVHADALHANLVANSIYAAVDRSGEDKGAL